MRIAVIIAFIDHGGVAGRILVEHLGLPAIASPVLPARAPPSSSVDHKLGHLELFIDPVPHYTTD